MDRAVLGEGDPAQHWRAVLRQIEADVPAVFLYAPTYVYAVKRRFHNVRLNPVSSWLLLREWELAPASSSLSR
jgi:hypothetical protein